MTMIRITWCSTPSSRRRLLSGALATLALASATVLATSKGPDTGGYTATDAAVFSFIDISGSNGGVSLLSGVDDGTATLGLPFQFQFYGQSYLTACVSTNGAFYFAAAAAECAGIDDFANVDLSATSPAGDRAALFPFWSDLTFQVSGAGSVFYKTLGTAGSRRFVVQWTAAYPQNSDNPVSFEVVLFETSNKVLFQYQTVNLGPGNPATQGALASVGIRAPGGPGSGKQTVWSFNAPVLTDASAIQFTSVLNKVVGDVDGDGGVTCTDYALVRGSVGKSPGQAGYDARADVNGDRVVNVTDLATVSRALPSGTRCS
jgi:hypothetical protein